MTPSDVFGIVVRTIGLVLTLMAVWAIGYALLALIGGGPGNIIGLLIIGVPELAVGLWFLRGARSLVRFAFPPEP